MFAIFNIVHLFFYLCLTHVEPVFLRIPNHFLIDATCFPNNLHSILFKPPPPCFPLPLCHVILSFNVSKPSQSIVSRFPGYLHYSSTYIHSQFYLAYLRPTHQSKHFHFYDFKSFSHTHALTQYRRVIFDLEVANNTISINTKN